MGWFGKLFGGGATLASVAKLVEQKRFAEAHLQAETLAEQDLSPEDAADLEALSAAAGDGLARLNLEEGLGLKRSGDTPQAADHFQLALEQVCSPELRAEIEQAAAEPLTPDVEVPPAPAAAGCDSCGPKATIPLTELDDLPDAGTQLELILTGYPEDLAERYRQKGELFLQAFLLSHAGRDSEALPLWDQVGDDDRDELYWFELGAAQARNGQLEEARTSLERSLQLKTMLLTIESLVPVLVALGEKVTARQHLQQLLDAGQDPAFCHMQLALLSLQDQQVDLGLTHARQAIASGAADASFLQLAASLLEQAGEVEEAETLLRRLPGGGCGGGMSLPLAEFLLRQERELAKVLDTFNAACRQEPDNPRWQLRVAQTYLARKWNKEGLKLLQMVVEDPRLDAELREEAQLLWASQKG